MTDTVVAALSKVMAELPAIGKGERSNEGYSYRGIETITKHLQPLLAKHGVVIVPSASLQNVVPSPEMKPGWQDAYLNVAWRIYGPGGDFIEAHTMGCGRDKSDKGVNKAQTQAFKYMLLHTFCIADKADDADGVSYEHDRVDEAPAYSAAVVELARRVREVPAGSELAAELKRLGAENGKRLVIADFAADPKWAELVAATLDAAQ